MIYRFALLGLASLFLSGCLEQAEETPAGRVPSMNDYALAKFQDPIFLENANRNRDHLFLCAMRERARMELAGSKSISQKSITPACAAYEARYRASVMAQLGDKWANDTFTLTKTADVATQKIYREALRMRRKR